LTNQPQNLRHMPRLNIDTEAIASRIRSLAETTLCGQCEIAVRVLTVDAANLIIEVHRLHDALIAARLESADLRAAIRATLGADADGEPDPLAYLRDDFPGADPYGWGSCR
jgi:hypothetical protein